jgi:hypothetical protein
MDAYLSTLLGSLATWRATHMLHAERGPGRVFERLRDAAGGGPVGQAIECFYCLSLWVSAPTALLLSRDWVERGLFWLGLSAAAIGLERVNGHWTLPAVASYFEDPPVAPPPRDPEAQIDLPLDTLPMHRVEPRR